MGFFDSIFKGPKNVMGGYIQSGINELNKVQAPDIETLKIKLDQLVQQGVITPEQAQAQLVQGNAYDDVSVNPEARGAQMSALEELQSQISNGGLTAVDQSRIQHTLDDVNNTERGQQQSIMEDAHRRGVSGSGIELANRLMSQQHAADTAGRQGMDIAAMAQQAKMDALKSAASIGGQVESQDYSEQAQKAAAQNTINQFNATNQQQVTLANIAANNAAQEANLREKQRVADANTSNENANRARNSGLIQNDYDNKLSKATAVSNLLGQQGTAAQNHENAVSKRNTDLFAGAVGTAATFGAGGMGGPGMAMAANQSAGGFSQGASSFPQGSPAMAPSTGYDPYQKNKYLNGSLGFSEGGKVPGAAPFPGDDPRNDVIDAKLSPGEVVIPRSEAQPSEYDAFMSEMPRSAEMPSADAVRVVLEALSGMGC